METIHGIIQEIPISLLTACNNYRTCFYTWTKIESNHSFSFFMLNVFLVLQKILSSSAFNNDK